MYAPRIRRTAYGTRSPGRMKIETGKTAAEIIIITDRTAETGTADTGQEDITTKTAERIHARERAALRSLPDKKQVRQRKIHHSRPLHVTTEDPPGSKKI